MGNSCRFHALLFLFLLPAALSGQSPSVVVNEIMFIPKSGTPEWFELYNGGAVAVNLKGWRMSDATGARPAITVVDHILPPGAYAVIAKDTSILQSFPELRGSLIVASVPSLNNAGDDLCIYLSDTTLVERISYSSSWGGASGVTLERKNPDAPGNNGSNWGTCIDPRGATPGARNSLRLRLRDLSLTPIRFVPELPAVGEPVTATLTVANRGTGDAERYTLQLFEDRDGNGSPEQSEKIFECSNTYPLRAGGSDSYRLTLSPSVGTIRIFLSLLAFPDDEYPADNSGADTLRIEDPPALRINEILYAPAGGEPEWIEIANVSDRPVSLRGMEIADSGTRVRITDGDTIVPPAGFALLARSGAISAHHANIPAPVLVLNLPSLNNGGDEVRLFDRSGRRVDSVRYFSAWGGAANGFSLERKDAASDGNDPGNWSSSTDAERSSPGRENSNRIRNIDGAIVSFALGSEGLRLLVRNAGARELTDLEAAIFLDADGDSLAEESERLGASLRIPPLRKRDSVEVRLPPDTIAGLHLLIARLECAGDENPENNVRALAVAGGYPAGTLALNEVLFAPAPGGAEYVEYVNMTDEPVNLAEWSFADQPTVTGRNFFSLAQAPLLLAPRGYFVLASDSTIYGRFPYLAAPSAERTVTIARSASLQLNNDEDDCVLRDASGRVIDSVRYSAAWHNPMFTSTTGLALERVNPARDSQDGRTWSSCVAAAGGTPGKRNSVYSDAAAAAAGSMLTIFPNPCSTGGEGREGGCTVRWNFPAAVPQVRLRIFNASGKLVRTLGNGQAGGASGEITWDGLDENRCPLPSGMYIVFLEGMNLAGEATRSVKRVVVVR